MKLLSVHDYLFKMHVATCLLPGSVIPVMVSYSYLQNQQLELQHDLFDALNNGRPNLLPACVNISSYLSQLCNVILWRVMMNKKMMLKQT